MNRDIVSQGGLANVRSFTCGTVSKTIRCTVTRVFRPAIPVAFVIMSATPSVAAFAQRGSTDVWYAGAGAAYSSVEVCDIWGCLYSDTVDPDTGLSVLVGRRFTERFALELGYIDFGMPKWGDVGARYHVDASGLHAGAIWSFPFFNRWKGYIKPGVIAVDATSRVDVFDFSTNQYVDSYRIDSNATELMLAGGAELFLSETSRVRFGLQWQEMEGRLLDERDGTLQAILVEFHRGVGSQRR